MVHAPVSWLDSLPDLDSIADSHDLHLLHGERNMQNVESLFRLGCDSDEGGSYHYLCMKIEGDKRRVALLPHRPNA